MSLPNAKNPAAKAGFEFVVKEQFADGEVSVLGNDRSRRAPVEVVVDAGADDVAVEMGPGRRSVDEGRCTAAVRSWRPDGPLL